MRTGVSAVLSGVIALCTVWQTGGCGAGLANLVPEQAVDFDLGAGLGQFDVQAGVPARKQGLLSFDPAGITIGRGSLEIDPDVITLAPGDASGDKRATAWQAADTVDVCVDACGLAGVGAAQCQDICDGGELHVTVWVGSADEADTVCETGDRYPQNADAFVVTLDEDGVPVAVAPSRVTLVSRTVELLNSGEVSVCIEVISPADGTVLIDSLTFNLGL